MNDWVAAGIAVVAGVVIGTVASRVVLRVLGRSTVPSMRQSAAPLAGLALAIGFVAGLLVALGFVSPDDLDRLRADAVDFLPRAIAALIIVVLGSVAASFAADAVTRSLAGTGAAARFAPVVTKLAIVAGAAVIAAAQAGVDTAIVNIGVAALLFGIAASVALLTGLGGQRVAGEIAAGRAWQRQLQPGDRVRAHGVHGAPDVVEGIVVEVHPTAVELYVDGTTVFVPNSQLLAAVVERTRPARADATGELSP